MVDRSLDELSPREWELLELALQGYSNREIGEVMYLSRHGVSSTIKRLLAKIGGKTDGLPHPYELRYLALAILWNEVSELREKLELPPPTARGLFGG